MFDERHSSFPSLAVWVWCRLIPHTKPRPPLSEIRVSRNTISLNRAIFQSSLRLIDWQMNFNLSSVARLLCTLWKSIFERSQLIPPNRPIHMLVFYSVLSQIDLLELHYKSSGYYIITFRLEKNRKRKSADEKPDSLADDNRQCRSGSNLGIIIRSLEWHQLTWVFIRVRYIWLRYSINLNYLHRERFLKQTRYRNLCFHWALQSDSICCEYVSGCDARMYVFLNTFFRFSMLNFVDESINVKCWSNIWNTHIGR